MFENIGGKIKTLAKVFCALGIVASVISGVLLFTYDFFIGIITLLLGSVGAWISSFCLYGFGELIEKVTNIAEHCERNDFQEIMKEEKEYDNQELTDSYYRAISKYSSIDE